MRNPALAAGRNAEAGASESRMIPVCQRSDLCAGCGMRIASRDSARVRPSRGSSAPPTPASSPSPGGQKNGVRDVRPGAARLVRSPTPPQRGPCRTFHATTRVRSAAQPRRGRSSPPADEPGGGPVAPSLRGCASTYKSWPWELCVKRSSARRVTIVRRSAVGADWSNYLPTVGNISRVNADEPCGRMHGEGRGAAGWDRREPRYKSELARMGSAGHHRRRLLTGPASDSHGRPSFGPPSRPVSTSSSVH